MFVHPEAAGSLAMTAERDMPAGSQTLKAWLQEGNTPFATGLGSSVI